MVLQGQRRHRGRARCRAERARLRPGRRRGTRDRRHLRHRPRRHALPLRLRACQRVLGPRDGTGELSLPRPFQAAAGKLRARAAGGPAAARRARHLAHPPRGRGHLRTAIPFGRGQHVAQHREPGTPPLQVRPVPSAGRRACPHVRHRHPVLCRRSQLPGGRRVRDRGAGFRAAADEPAADGLRHGAAAHLARGGGGRSAGDRPHR